MFVQAGGIVSANIYQAGKFGLIYHFYYYSGLPKLIDDAPRYVRGNRALLGINCMNIVIYLLTKVYFMARNRYREKKWAAMSESERLDYLATTTDEGNKRLDFRFQH